MKKVPHETPSFIIAFYLVFGFAFVAPVAVFLLACGAAFFVTSFVAILLKFI